MKKIAAIFVAAAVFAPVAYVTLMQAAQIVS
jgi:hypothetical protein